MFKFQCQTCDVFTDDDDDDDDDSDGDGDDDDDDDENTIGCEGTRNGGSVQPDLLRHRRTG